MVLSLMPLKVLLLHAAKGSIQLTRPSTSGAKLNLSLPIDTMGKLRAWRTNDSLHNQARIIYDSLAVQGPEAIAQSGPTLSWLANEDPRTPTTETFNHGFVDLKRELRVVSLSDVTERVCEEWQARAYWKPDLISLKISLVSFKGWKYRWRLETLTSTPLLRTPSIFVLFNGTGPQDGRDDTTAWPWPWRSDDTNKAFRPKVRPWSVEENPYSTSWMRTFWKPMATRIMVLNSNAVQYSGCWSCRRRFWRSKRLAHPWLLVTQPSPKPAKVRETLRLTLKLQCSRKGSIARKAPNSLGNCFCHLVIVWTSNVSWTTIS